MELQNFNLDLRPDKGFQVVCAYSVAKNAFMILGEFNTERIARTKKVKIKTINFAIKYLNNDIRYVVLKHSFEFIPIDNMGLPGVKICLKTSDNPNFDVAKFEFSPPLEVNIGGNGKLRFHLDFSEDCGGDTTNVGGWPCLTNKLV
ncbi:MAG: hypothetical protein ABJH82_05595 [Polaribacter sp.]|uniref:hypothetical protein n=1 Tax=Polaribacter sp. TaxID=1920175 RepID=UPI0032674473